MRTHKIRSNKYVGKIYDAGWQVTENGILSVQSPKNVSAYHRGYWYKLGRLTSDGKFDKWIKVNGTTMWKIDRGLITVEQVEAKQKKKNVNYNFR